MSLLLAAKKKRPGEEAAGPSYTAAPVVAPVVPVVSEDFVGAAATGVAYEDTLPALVLAATLVTLPGVVEEEFGGAHPYEDGVAAQVSVVVAPLVAAPVDEVIAPSGAGLDEQVAQATVTVAAPVWISGIVSEEFAGSLPLDEQAAAVAVISAPSWLAPVSREEGFGLPHPIEEAWWSLPSIAPVWISAPSLGEEFAGSLPADEAPVEGVDLVPLFARLVFVDLGVASEEFAGLHVDEEPGALATVTARPTAAVYVDFGEDFAGSLPLEEVAGAVALHWQAITTSPARDESVGEVFPGAMVNEEPGAVFLWPPPVFIAPADVGEEFVRRVVPPPPPPIPPPPPPRPVIPSIGGTGGFVAAPYRPMLPCPPGTEWVYDPAKKTMVCRRLEPERVEQQTDYAILPLEGEVVVKALADGVVDTFIDSKGRTVTRLTSDDGTVYYYANVRGARSGRVTKDQPIGVSKTDERESKLLTAGGTGDVTQPSTEPGTYGVLPIAKRPPQPPRPWHPTLYMRPMPPVVIEPQPRAIERQNIVRLVFLGLGVVGVVGFVWWLVSKRKQPRRRSRR